MPPFLFLINLLNLIKTVNELTFNPNKPIGGQKGTFFVDILVSTKFHYL